MQKSNFILYKELKQRFNIKCHGIYLNQILAVDIWNWANCSSKSKLNRWRFRNALDISFLDRIHSNRILFSDLDRNDHRNTFYALAEKVSSTYSIIDISKWDRDVQHYKFANIVKSIYFSFYCTNKLSFSIKEKLKIARYLCYLFNTIDLLFQTEIPYVSVFVAFSPVHPIESLLCQFFRIKKAKIIGLSHGLYPYFQTNIPIDCINYENLFVDTSLVWSRMAKDVLIQSGINANLIKVAGYPKHISTKPFCKNNSFKTCLVLLSRPQFESSNFSLINVLSEFSSSIEFYLKVHPGCKIECYIPLANMYGYRVLKKDTLLTDCMDNDKFDFAIAVNTTSYYEIMASGIPCMRYRDNIHYDIMPGLEYDAFSNVKEFSISFSAIRNQYEIGLYQTSVQNLLKYALGIDTDLYRDLLENRI